MRKILKFLPPTPENLRSPLLKNSDSSCTLRPHLTCVRVLEIERKFPQVFFPSRGEFRGRDGGGGGRKSPSLRESTWDIPLYFFETSVFVWRHLKFYKGTFGPNIYYFWGLSARQKRKVFGQNFPKSWWKNLFAQKTVKKLAKNIIFLVLWENSENQFCQFKKVWENSWNFSIFAQKIGQNRGFLVLWQSSENQICQPKKNLTKILKIFKFRAENWPKQSIFNALGDLGKSILST